VLLEGKIPNNLGIVTKEERKRLKSSIKIQLVTILTT